MGARTTKHGISGIHTHMTNTMNTPIEALEFAFPLRLKRYALRRGSGGRGQYNGGDGLIRDVEFLTPARVTILSERRKFPPPGFHGGHHGETGENVLLRGGFEEVHLAGKETLDVDVGDVLSIRTPGGGGWGDPRLASLDAIGDTLIFSSAINFCPTFSNPVATNACIRSVNTPGDV